jgi:hypothetical protein
MLSKLDATALKKATRIEIRREGKTVTMVAVKVDREDGEVFGEGAISRKRTIEIDGQVMPYLPGSKYGDGFFTMEADGSVWATVARTMKEGDTLSAVFGMDAFTTEVGKEKLAVHGDAMFLVVTRKSKKVDRYLLGVVVTAGRPTARLLVPSAANAAPAKS